ncbi:hypothetical protein CRG98_010553 [Punica granatum]|uniref:Uncharacterized protein n=1 Tax=Punica granatum TaxID=22663 RepID=A0A2I0KKM3_PUNGR|nr:hypothetical protein CRG98_010553 [Punica granatum]
MGSGGGDGANWRSRPLHRACWYPERTSATSIEWSGSPIGGPNPELIEDFESEVPGRFGVGASNLLPRFLHRGRRHPPWVPATLVEGLGSSIDGPKPKSTGDLQLGVLARFGVEVAGIPRGYRRPRWRGRGRRLVAPIPNRPGTSNSESLVDLGLGPPIGDPDPSTEVTSILCEYRRPRWRGQDRRLEASTPLSLSIFFKD